MPPDTIQVTKRQEVRVMNPKEIGRLAGRIFNRIIPFHIAVRSQEDQEDYGIDYEMEVISPEDKPTGFIFKVQQKGTESLKSIENEKMMVYVMAVDKVGYYLNELRMPVILVVVDVDKESTLWVRLQGNTQVENAFKHAISKNQKTITIHIPPSNCLPKTFSKMLESVRQINEFLLVKEIKQFPSQKLFEAAVKSGDPDGFGKAIQSHYDIFRYERIEDLIRSGQREKALQESWDLFKSPSESIKIRFSGGLNIVRISGGLLARQQTPDQTNQMIEIRSNIYTELLKLVRPIDTPKALRRYARFLLRTTRLRSIVEHDYGLLMSYQVQKESGDEFTLLFTQSARQSSAIRTLRELRKTQNTFFYLAAGEGLELIPQAWCQICGDILPFIQRLRIDGLEDVENQIVNWLIGINDIAIDISQNNKQWSDLVLCASLRVALSNPANVDLHADTVKRMKGIMQNIENEEDQKSGLVLIEQYEKLQQVCYIEPSIEEEIQMYKEMCRSLGINPDNPKNDVDEVVAIGLKDLNPERVLKCCQHLLVSIGSYGIPGQMLGLPTAGSKWLHCTKHRYSMMSLSLDQLYESFHTEYCKACKDCLPHDDIWQWSRTWQQEQDQKFQDIIQMARGF